MRLRCSGQSRLNETLLALSVARYKRTGMATIPKLMTPFQIDRGMPIHLAGPLPFFPRGLAARIVTVPSRKRSGRAAPAPGNHPEDTLKGRGVAMPVLPHDCAVGRAEDEAQGEGRDYGIVELPRDRHEIGDEVYWRREPQARDSNDDLRAKRDARVAQQPSKHPHEIRNQQCKFAREQHAADDDEDDREDDPDRDEDEKDLGPERKVHISSSRSPAPRGMSGSSPAR